MAKRLCRDEDLEDLQQWEEMAKARFTNHRRSRKRQRFFHATKAPLRPGIVLVGRGHCLTHHGKWVFVTDSPLPHYTVLERACRENWQVYEVRPLGKKRVSTFWDEIICQRAVVVRRVGHARGIAANARMRWIDKENTRARGSMVRLRHGIGHPVQRMVP